MIYRARYPGHLNHVSFETLTYHNQSYRVRQAKFLVAGNELVWVILMARRHCFERGTAWCSSHVPHPRDISHNMLYSSPWPFLYVCQHQNGSSMELYRRRLRTICFHIDGVRSIGQRGKTTSEENFFQTLWAEIKAKSSANQSNHNIK